ncbi:MAG TPA: hypothetical protein VF604_15070 [Pyrinomonadaceae bacterium]|jgi:hypothetical protein
MKIALAVALMVLVSGLSFAQDLSAEKDFEKNRVKLKLEKFSMGEDATTGYDYLVYTDKAKIVKIRSIWSSSAGVPPRVEDYYFRDGTLILYVKMPAQKRQFKELVKGRSFPLAAEEKLYLKDSKLAAWIEKGKTIPASDNRWSDREKEILETAKAELDNYQSMKDENK